MGLKLAPSLLVLAISVGCALAPTSSVRAQTVPRDLALPIPLYAPYSAWNQTAVGAQVLPQSIQQILVLYRVMLGDNSSLHPPATPPPNPYPFPFVNYDDFSVPVFRMGQAQQTVLMRDYAGNQRWTNPTIPQAADGTVTIPAPAGVVRPSGPQSREADGHLVLFNPQTFLEHDFWDATTALDASGNSLGGGYTGTRILQAGAIERFDGRGAGTDFPTFFSARATGVPLLAGLIVPEDIESGRIDHALAFAIPGPRNTNLANPSQPFQSDYFYPASITEVIAYNTDPLALAAGQRIRLRQSIVDGAGNPIDEDQLVPITRMFLRGLRTYGAYLVDNSGGFIFYAEDIHSAVLHLTDADVNTLVGQPPATPLPAGKTKWQIAMETLNAQLANIPLAFGPWQSGQDPRTATINISNFDVVEPAAVPPTAFQTIVPHDASGGGFQTRLFINSLTQTANSITLRQISTDGSVVGSNNATLQPGGTFLLANTPQQRNQSLSTEWLVIGSEGPVSASVLFDCCVAGSEVTTAAGVLAQAPGSNFTAPYIYQRYGLSSLPALVEGVAFANISDQPNTVNIRLLDEMGAQVAQDTLTPLPSFGQTIFVIPDFSQAKTPNINAFLATKDTFLGSLVLSGTYRFAPVIVGNLGGRLFSLPLVSLPSSATLAIIPHFAFGGGYATRLFVKNLATIPSTVNIQFMNQSGTVENNLPPVSLSAGQTIQLSSNEASRSLPMIFQWVLISSDQPVAASALLDCCSTGTTVTTAICVLGQATAGSSFASPYIYERQIEGNQPLLVEGLAIANFSSSTNSVTVRLLDENRAQVAQDSMAALQGFQQTAFVIPDPTQAKLPQINSYLLGRDSFLGSLTVTGTQPFVPMIVGGLGTRLFSLPLIPQ